MHAIAPPPRVVFAMRVFVGPNAVIVSTDQFMSPQQWFLMNDDAKTSTDDPWKAAAPPLSIALLSVKLHWSMIISLKPDAWMPPPSLKALQLTKAHLVSVME
jgi:hypothetical protein